MMNNANQGINSTSGTATQSQKNHGLEDICFQLNPTGNHPWPFLPFSVEHVCFSKLLQFKVLRMIFRSFQRNQMCGGLTMNKLGKFRILQKYNLQAQKSHLILYSLSILVVVLSYKVFIWIKNTFVNASPVFYSYYFAFLWKQFCL